MSSNRFIALAELREDSIQPRVGLNTDAVARYAAPERRYKMRLK